MYKRGAICTSMVTMVIPDSFAENSLGSQIFNACTYTCTLCLLDIPFGKHYLNNGSINVLVEKGCGILWPG